MAEPARAAPLAERLALVFGAGGARAALEALAEVEAEILGSARAGIDHGVAHARLEWWRGEAERLAAGTPRHPAAQRLRAAAGGALDAGRLLELVTAAEMRVVGYAPAGEAELLAHLDRAHGAREALIAALLAPAPDPALVPWARALGRGLGLSQALEAADPAILGALEADALERLARAALGEALALPAPARAWQRHGLVRARLALESLDRAGAATPALRQWWLAWRTARRALGSAP